MDETWTAADATASWWTAGTALATSSISHFVNATPLLHAVEMVATRHMASIC